MPEHEHSDEWQARIDAVWGDGRLTPDEVVERISALASELPDDDPRGPFELGGAYDSAGYEHEAALQYERAIALGLDGRARSELNIQYASTLRNLDRADEAVEILSSDGDPELAASQAAFLALALHSAGRADEALAVALETLIPQLPRYQRSLAGYAALLREGGSEATGSRGAPIL